MFQKAAAYLALDKPSQSPNLDGLNRKEINIFGEPAESVSVQTVIVQDLKGEEILLRGGRALGIYQGTLLKRISNGASPIEIEVTSEEGIAFSRAKVVKHGAGNHTVNKGDVFQVVQWAVPSAAMLKSFSSRSYR